MDQPSSSKSLVSPDLSQASSEIGKRNETYCDNLSLGSSTNESTVNFAINQEIDRPSTSQRDGNESVPEKRDIRQHKPVGSFVRLGRGIRGFWRTTATEGVDKEENRDLFVRMTLRELGIYIVFLVTLNVMAFCMLDPSMFQFTKVMLRLFVDNPDLPNINTDVGFWKYVEQDLINGLFWEKYYNGKDVHHSEAGYIYFENKVMGRARLRQLRVKDKSCHVDPMMRQVIDNCYTHYSPENEDRTRFGIANDTEYNNTAWIYQSAEKLQYRPFVGRLASYDGGGYTRLLSDNSRESKERMADLKQKLWIDRATRAVFVEFSVYNANLNLFCLINVLFEFPSTGAVTTIYRFSTLKLLRYVTTMDYFVMGCEGVFLLFLLYYTIEEIIEIKVHGFAYFGAFWNIFDIFVLILGYGALCLNLYRTFEVNTVLESILRNRDDFSNFSIVAFWQEKFNDVIAIAVFMYWFKVFKYISFNQTMAELESTLITCAKDVAGFCVMFFLIFFAYAQWGYAVFGAHIRDFSSIGNCMLTLFRIILGDFDFPSMQETKPFWGPFYFISYIFMVFFVLLNMFLAIVNDTYCEVKEELDEEFQPFDVGGYFKSGAKKIINNLSKKYYNVVELKDILKHADLDGDNEIDFDEWRTYLKKRGHADGEIEATFAKYDKDGDRVLNVDELENMLEDLDEEEDDIQKEIDQVKQANNAAERLLSKLMLRDEHDDGESSEEEDGSDEEEEERFATGEEFRTLLKRVDNTEHSIGSIVSKVQAVLLKLEAMDIAKVKRRETMSRLIDSIGEYMDKPVNWASEASFARIGESPSSKGRQTAMSKQQNLMSVKVES